MKKLIVLLAIASLSFISCNNGEYLGCQTISYSALNDAQQAALQNAGFDVGMTMNYNGLDSTNKAAFIANGLDTTKCCKINP